MPNEAPSGNSENARHRLQLEHSAAVNGRLKGSALLALLALIVVVLCVPMHARVGIYTFNTNSGLTDDDEFLDGSRSIFQSLGFHPGNGTRCWGTTYGMKVGRLYWRLSTLHGSPEDDVPMCGGEQ